MNSASQQRQSVAQPYKTTVARIRNLRWNRLDGEELQVVMYLSWVAAVEFAEALRIALKLYPTHEGLREMAHGELKTKNLLLDDFTEAGDHHEFLGHFLRKHGLMDRMEARYGERAERYLAECRRLSEEDRAMTVFSREDELSGIFAEILKAPDWSALNLYAFQHYLSRHISFDTGEGGHHDLTSDFPVDERVAPFYTARLETFRLIPSLWDTMDDADNADQQRSATVLQ
ncbi:hypothetical protein GALL_230690 [mine drainage metagenome]|uniref:Uncharacterized protein n=1 Tax=mine drainage metagenome TaxID=410659 RepID=A0A1J5RFU3_9ZZZZ